MGSVSDQALASGVSDALLAATGSLFPRVIEVHRLQTIAQEPSSIGDTGYSGAEQGPASATVEGEIVLYTGIPANVQVGAAGRSKGPLPTDVTYKPVWRILIPAGAVPKFSIRDRDIIVDDEGYRYGISAAMWTPQGYSLDTVRLEA